MKIKIDDKEIFELTEIQLKCIQNDLPASECMQDLERRLIYVLQNKYEQCFKRLKKDWEPKLRASGKKTVPLDDDKFAELIFSLPEYKDREARDKETK